MKSANNKIPKQPHKQQKIKQTTVKIREPIKTQIGLNFVAFTKEDCLDCQLNFTYGPGFPNQIFLALRMPGKPSSVEVYDLFNSILKPLAFKTEGMRNRVSGMKVMLLTSRWELEKENFDKFAEKVGEMFGEEWQTELKPISDQIGKGYCLGATF